MHIHIPKECSVWLKDHNPTEGDLLFAATLTLFAKLYGTKTFIEMEPEDIKHIIWDKPTLLGVTHLLRLQEQGLIQIVRGLDEVVTFRFNPDLKIKHVASGGEDATIEIPLKEEKTMALCFYLLGRLAYIRVSGTRKDIVIIDNKYDAREGKVATVEKEKKKKHPDMPTGKRKYVRKAYQKHVTNSKLNTIPKIYMDQLTTKQHFEL
jgi:hypothetical protein